MKDVIYKLYGKIREIAKKLLGISYTPSYRLVNVNESELSNDSLVIRKEDKCAFFNEKIMILGTVAKQELFPTENVVKIGSFSRLQDSFVRNSRHRTLGVEYAAAVSSWKIFIQNSKIPQGYRNEGLSYAGYIAETQNWCLPSWIWTNAALVRMNCFCGNFGEAKRITDILVSMQRPEGGWIVRFDYDAKGAIPVLAPNDSAYIANNACLEMYLATNDRRYLDSAERCANWIIETARSDGMVYVGYDFRESKWQKKYNIVDVGFTMGLFSRLYQVNEDRKYKDFLNRFADKYIELFYIRDKGFATSLDKDDCKKGGMFGRGQAWALEGLIPYYKLNKEKRIEVIINNTIKTLLKCQTHDGGWPYNLTRKLMGLDCKATAIIALALWKWYEINPDRIDCLNAAENALKWCANHTEKIGRGKGGIFSYSTEGAIVHSHYTSTAFVYSCAYAVELDTALKRINR